MPKRTNLFQEVVELIHTHMAGEASVDPSGFLPSRSTGAPREVDVVIRGRTAGHDVIVSVEAISRSRKATREWVDQMTGKHADLPTNKLILVSERGFTKDARQAALAAHAVPLAPQDLGEDSDTAITLAVRSLWPKLITFTPETFATKFVDDKAPVSGWHSTVPPVYVSDGTEVAPSLGEFAYTMFTKKRDDLYRQAGIAQLTEDRVTHPVIIWTDLRVRVNDAMQDICLRNDNGALYSLKWLKVTGELKVQVSEIPIVGRRLGEVVYAFGEGEVGDRAALVVTTAKADSEEGVLTLRIRPEGYTTPDSAPPEPDNPDFQVLQAPNPDDDNRAS